MDIDDNREILGVLLNGTAHAYRTQSVAGNTVLLCDTPVSTDASTLSVSLSATEGDSRLVLSLSPMSLTFSAVAGGANPAAQTLTVAGDGGTLHWTATVVGSGPEWLAVAPASGTGGGTLTASVNAAGLAAGTYSRTIRVAAADAVNSPQTATVTLTVTTPAFERYVFDYPDRASLLAAGWNFLARTASGAHRNTEVTSGAVVSYNQAVHPGLLRIPVDRGNLWGRLNNSRNSIFRSLPADWSRVQLTLSFSPTLPLQEAGLVVYQDDDNYVQVMRTRLLGERVLFVRESSARPALLAGPLVRGSNPLHLRLDRNASTGVLSGFCSFDGHVWTALGNVAQILNNPRVGVVVGGSLFGLPKANIAALEVHRQ